MGNLMQDNAAAVHGVLYRLRCVDFCTLANMEHEYRSAKSTTPVLVGINDERIIYCFNWEHVQTGIQGEEGCSRHSELAHIVARGEVGTALGGPQWPFDGLYL